MNRQERMREASEFIALCSRVRKALGDEVPISELTEVDICRRFTNEDERRAARWLLAVADMRANRTGEKEFE